MKTFIAILVAACSLAGQTVDSAPRKLAQFTVGTLPAAASWTNAIVLVTDGASAGDCTVGSGAIRVTCASNGSAWASTGGSGGSGVTGLSVDADGTVKAGVGLTTAAPYAPTYNAGGTTTCDWAISNTCTFTTTSGNTTLAVLHPHGSGPYTLIVTQGATPRTVTYPGTFTGNFCTISATGTKVTTIVMLYDGSTNYRESSCVSDDTADTPVTGPASSTANNCAKFADTTGKVIADLGTPCVPAQYKTLSCQPGLGDGTNAITAATYLQSTCWNKTGVTVTLTSIQCFTDNAGSSTLAVTNGAGTALLTGAVTCSSTIASGTQSGTTTIAANDFLKFTFVADGTSKQTTWVIAGTN